MGLGQCHSHPGDLVPRVLVVATSGSCVNGWQPADNVGTMDSEHLSTRHGHRRLTMGLLAAVTLLGAVLRLWELGGSSLWMDEALSWRLQSFPALQLISRSGEPATCHPPVYFLLLKGWTAAFGDADVTLRVLSSVIGILLIPAMYYWGVETCAWVLPRNEWSTAGPIAGVTAAMIVACNSLQVYLSQQARGYTLTAVLATMSAALLLRALRATDRAAIWWSFWSIAASLMCYTSNLGPLTVAAEVLVAGVLIGGQMSMKPNRADVSAADDGTGSPPQRPLLLPIIAATAVAIVYLPWVANAFGQAKTLSESFQQDLTWKTFLSAMYGAIFFGARRDASFWAQAVAVVAVLGLHFVVWWKGKQAGASLVLWSLLPLWVLLSFSLVSTRSIFLARYLFVPQLGWALMLGIVPILFRRTEFRTLAFGAVFAFVGTNLMLTVEHVTREREPGMRGAMAYLRAQATRDEPVLTLTPQVFLTAKPYLSEEGRLRLVSLTRDRQRHSGGPLLLESDLVPPDWPRRSGARSFWLIRSDSYRFLGNEDLNVLEQATVENSQRLAVTQWEQENWWERPVLVEHYAEASPTAQTSPRTVDTSRP